MLGKKGEQFPGEEGHRWDWVDSRGAADGLLRAEQHLGRAVPQRDDLVRVGAQRHREGAGQPEVGNLQQPGGRLHEQVLRLDVAVEDAVRVAPADPADQLVGEGADHLGLEAGVAVLADRAHVLLHLQKTGPRNARVSARGRGRRGWRAREERGRRREARRAHIADAVLEAEVERAVGLEDVLQLHDVAVAQLAQDRDLAQRRGRHAVVLAVEPHLLERHELAGHDVLRLVHDAVRALAKLLQLAVLVVRLRRPARRLPALGRRPGVHPAGGGDGRRALLGLRRRVPGPAGHCFRRSASAGKSTCGFADSKRELSQFSGRRGPKENLLSPWWLPRPCSRSPPRRSSRCCLPPLSRGGHYRGLRASASRGAASSWWTAAARLGFGHLPC